MAAGCLLAAVVMTFATAASATADEVAFETHVRPILKAHCWHCHGEEPELRGGLDARLAKLLQRGGDSGAAVHPGDHEHSLLYQRVASGEMPPGEKKLTTDELRTLAAWIDGGARTVRPEPEAPDAAGAFTDEDRQHWAFQPISRPAVPTDVTSAQTANPIDAFLLHELNQRGLSFSAEADRATLIRRLSFDLHGLPPSPESIDAFVSDTAPDAWPSLVQRLLDAPAYGEHWARHWLDVAGYADSDGYTEADPVRSWSWKYRDYVIRSFNSDTPWNEFLVEQLAGDELLTPPFEDLTADQTDQLVATGFLRMAPDGTADGGVDQPTARNDVIAETIKTVSTSLLGLSVGCAQCHEHRYDPIAQEDYYRLRAIFEPAFDPSNWRAPSARLVSMWSAETRAAAAAVDAELSDISTRRTAALDQLVNETFEKELLKLPSEQQPLARVARETAADKRSAEQQQLIKEYPFLNVDRGSVYLYLPDRQTGFNKTWDDLTEQTKKKRPADDLVMCLSESPGQIPATKLFARGDHQQPRQEILPGELSILCTAETPVIPSDDEQLPTSGRRLAWARHLTSGHHPLVARVLVNRFWMHHFGQGLVTTPADFGLKGDRPSHPELLDWLAREFMDHGWSLKHLHRLILTSAAWRQQSLRRPDHDAIDPDNRLLGRMNVRRLESESVRDAILAISGRLNTKMYGPPAPVSPDDIGQIVIAVDTRDSAGRPSGKTEDLGGEDLRRSIYVQVRRSMPLGVLEPFDMPRMTPNCELRPSSTTPTQALMMLNHPFIVQQADALAARLQTTNADERAQVILAWKLVFGTTPSDDDVATSLEFLNEAASSGTESTDAQRALGHWCHALFCSNRFLYVE